MPVISVGNQNSLRDRIARMKGSPEALESPQLFRASHRDAPTISTAEQGNGKRYHFHPSDDAASSISAPQSIAHNPGRFQVERRDESEIDDRGVSPVAEPQPINYYNPKKPAHHQQPSAAISTPSAALAPDRAVQHIVGNAAPRQPPPSSDLPVDLPLAEFSQEDIDRLNHRASRAWGLFQMTKAVSHWYVWTEEKGNRAAVAKRHMTRFRHFGQWHDSTADAKHYSKRLLVSRVCKLWARNAERVSEEGQSVTHRAASLAVRNGLNHWTISIRTQLQSLPRVLTPIPMRIQSQQWREHASELQERGVRAQHAAGSFLMSTVMSTWQRATRLANDARQFHRQRNYNDALSVWGLASKSHDFQVKLFSVKLQAILNRWHSIGQTPLPAQHHTFHDRRGAEVSIRRLDGPRAFTMIHRRSLMARVLETWRHDTIGVATAIDSAERFSLGTDIRHGLSAWYNLVGEADERQLWAGRAHRYLTMTACLHKARQLARPSWSHTTRTRYARARWKQKHLNARNLLSGWRRQVRACARLQQAGHSREVELSGRRLIFTLHAWQEECQGLLTLDWPSHMPSSWLNEWAVSEESLRLLHDEASAAWQSSLKTRVYNRWRTFSVQFHSQLYIVTDVLEKNQRKSTRRVLLHWHQGAHSTSHPSLHSVRSSRGTTTSRGPGSSLWSSRQLGATTASSLIGLGERGWPERVDEQHEDSEAGDSQGLLNTPTRWTGLGVSLTRLPTTTPLAPLSTPFERELRGRYDETRRMSGPALPESHSVRGTPRLSASDARRIAEERRRKWPI